MYNVLQFIKLESKTFKIWLLNESMSVIRNFDAFYELFTFTTLKCTFTISKFPGII